MARYRLLAVLVIVILTATSCTTTSEPSDSNTSNNPTGASVTIDNFTFEPATLSIDPGTTVTWSNAQGVPHTVTADDGEFSSDNLSAQGTFSFTFEAPGTYPYHCAIHPNMTATITVNG